MKIPPPGDEGVPSFVNLTIQESNLSPWRAQWESEVDRWIALYVGEASPDATVEPGLGIEGGRDLLDPRTEEMVTLISVIINRIQTQVISMVAIQGGDQPRIQFTPREAGEPPVYYLNTLEPSAVTLMQGLQGIDPMAPLPPDVVEYVRLVIAQGQTATLIAAQSGLPPPAGVVKPEALVEISDRTAADFSQTVIEGMWEAAGLQHIFTQNILNKNILGWQVTGFDFDWDLKVPILTNFNSKHVFLPPEGTDQRRFHYVIVDEVMSADEAMAKYPDKRKEIAANVQSNSLNFTGATYDPSDIYQQQFHRDMVILRRAWYRWQPYPMTEEEAVGNGFAEIQQIPVAAMRPVLDELGQPVVAEDGSPLTEPDPTAVREALVVDGSEIEPGAEGWPTKYAVREIVTINNVTMIDQQCPYDMIPVSVNVNTPIPNCPYGQGEPKNLEGLQTALNRLYSSIVTNHAYNAYPPELRPQSVADALGDALKKLRSQPGQVLNVPDDLIRDLGGLQNCVAQLPAQNVPTDAWKLIDFTVRMIDEVGNQANVLKGNAAPGWSGDAIASLQNAASQVIKAKSLHTEQYLKILARLMHAAMRDERFTEQDAARYCSKYPIQVLQAFRAREKSLDMDISIEVTSGSGASKQAETNNLLAAKGAGVPVSNDTVLERLRLDPKSERQKRLVEAAEESQLAGARPQPAGDSGNNQAA